MNKVYQPIVIQKTQEIITILKETNFFTDYEIENLTFTENYLKDKLTEKFILGELDMSDDPNFDVFNDDEFDEIIRCIVAGSILYDLKTKGYVNSYEDENTEETFFLTEEGNFKLNKIKISDDKRIKIIDCLLDLANVYNTINKYSIIEISLYAKFLLLKIKYKLIVVIIPRNGT